MTGKSLTELFIALDVALVGKPDQAEHVARSQDHLFQEPIRFLTDLYYLSDGGYSRVGYNELSERLFLASESRTEVKVFWNSPKAQELIREISSQLKAIYAAMEEQDKPAGPSGC